MNKQSRIGRWSVIIGIVIVLNLFFNYALSLVYKQKNIVDFCPVTQVNEPIVSKDQCLAVGGQWNGVSNFDSSTFGKQYGVAPADPTISPYCDKDFTCRQNFDKATQSYNRNVFIILVILGAISVLAGNFFAANEVIASGFSLAGVLSFVIASIRYWSSADNLIKVLILAIALGLLFWVAYKKFKNPNV